MSVAKPTRKPTRPHFSSGPCAKRPGWSLDALADAAVGRSHRSKIGKAKLKEVIERTKALLQMPDDYVLGIVPASDTGAFEMAMWGMLGERPVDVFAWESFGKGWVTDIQKQLKLADVRAHIADYGQLPNLAEADFDRDVVFTWNGTTSGVCVPGGDWIPADRAGLTLCDATSGVFAMALPWDKLDVVTWSWQKVLGGEGAHGMLALSPRAVARLETYNPPWPMPKIFRLLKGGKLNGPIFEGSTINTPSMLCVEDALDALDWVASIGGRAELQRRSRSNLGAIAAWVADSEWAAFLADDAGCRSTTSICLVISDPWFAALAPEVQAKIPKAIAGLLEEEDAAYDIASYRDAPPGLRIWGGATVDTDDVEALLPWLDWAYGQVKAKHG